MMVLRQVNKLLLVCVLIVHSFLFSMFNNTFKGTIPDTLGNLKDLIALYLDENELSGQIPTSLGQMTSMTDLRYVIYFLILFSVRSLSIHVTCCCGSPRRLRCNKLTGTIPSELGDLIRLEVGQFKRKH